MYFCLALLTSVKLDAKRNSSGHFVFLTGNGAHLRSKAHRGQNSCVWQAISQKIFFFKQKTAYEIGVRLVGSEMCIRDSDYGKVS